MTQSANDHLPRIERIEDLREEDLKEECNVCNGRRVVPSEKVILREPCRACGGSGKLYWVDKAMHKHSQEVDSSIVFSCARDNITFLMQILKTMGDRMGYDIQIEIKARDYAYHTHSPLYINRNILSQETLDASSYIKKMGGF